MFSATKILFLKENINTYSWIFYFAFLVGHLPIHLFPADSKT